MANGLNLASKYAPQVDERFVRESQAMIALNNNYDFTGEKTVNVYSIPIAPLNDFNRNPSSGNSAYGPATDLARNIQTMTVNQDKGFNIRIEKGDYLQSQMVMEAGKVLSRQLDEVIVPFFDTYVFKTLADAAQENGGYAETEATTSNAYSLFLAGMEWMGNHNVPDKGRVCFCSYNFANLLKQDSAFMKYGDMSQEMLNKGVIGEVDGCMIVKVPNSKLPAGAAFIITHNICATAPKQLEEFKTHENPVGWSGWVIEGRLIFDCFVLNEKADGIYYLGGQPILKSLPIMTAATNTGKSTIVVNGTKAASTNKWMYVTAATHGALAAVTYGTAFTSGTELTAAQTEVTPTSGHKYVRVVEIKAADNKPVAFGDAILNIG